ncbi:MAG: polysaccharide biosynthesis protein [Candidatus Heimdallarchaeota archaeon]|nr:polysaccharide biosynthesis protein [Candidatus Heimdallarchaeota archaeon]
MKTAKLENLLNGKIILITGGSGSIGLQIAMHLLNNYTPHVIRILTNDENSLFSTKLQLQDQPNVRFFLGDIRDEERVKKAIENVNVLFHAAALKHVEMCEYNPFEAIKTNVLGTQNLINAALTEDISHFILISTDKAASPLNVMGATKLLAEKLVSSAMGYRGNSKTIFTTVRFGNVFGTRGSIFPIIKEQVLKKEKIEIRNPELTRFLMSIKEALNLVFFALENSKGGEVFLPKMKSIKIDKLIGEIVQFVCEEENINREDIEIITTYVKAGEKIHEELITEDELRTTVEYENYYILQTHLAHPNQYNWVDNHSLTDLKSYSSENSPSLSKEEVTTLMQNIKDLKE